MKVDRLLPVAKPRLVTVGTDALLLAAARLLSDRQHNLVVVCDDAGKMAGVITKTDIVSRIGDCTGSSCTAAAATIMTRDVIFCCLDDWLTDVWERIKEHGLKNIPVVDEARRPHAVLNVRDALHALLEHVQNEEELLRDYVMGVGYR